LQTYRTLPLSARKSICKAFRAICLQALLRTASKDRFQAKLPKRSNTASAAAHYFASETARP
jgi:hypothetical protein